MRYDTSKKAFSLIELSIVLLIIGIIIAGVTQSSRLIRQFKITTAQNKTSSGPVASIKNLGLWYETTLTDSFIDFEAQDSATASNPISTWKDINPQNSTKNNATQNININKPLYDSGCINILPCLKFDGVSSFMNFDGSFLVGTDYTIFVIFQRRNGGVNGSGSIIGRLTTTALNQSIELGHFADSGGHAVFAFGQGDPNNYYVVGSANPTIPAFSTPSPALHVIVNSTIASGQSTFAHYYNGYRSSNIRTASTLTSIGTPSAMQSLISFPDAIIGHDITMDTLVGRAHLNGDLGEIIIYTRALKNEERIVVEDYLMQKWGISEL